MHSDIETINQCCYINSQTHLQCNEEALWTIFSTKEDYTESCTKHVGFLLAFETTNYVYPIKRESFLQIPIYPAGSLNASYAN